MIDLPEINVSLDNWSQKVNIVFNPPVDTWIFVNCSYYMLEQKISNLFVNRASDHRMIAEIKSFLTYELTNLIINNQLILPNKWNY